MIKVQTNCSIDDELKKKAQDKGLNISAILEDALRLRLCATKKDAPEQSIVLKCDACKEFVEEGYFCEISKRFLCKDCEFAQIKVYNDGAVLKFPCIKRDHEHLLIPGFNEVNIDKYKKVAQIGSNDEQTTTGKEEQEIWS